MINIPISNVQKENMEEIYWKWFKNQHLSKLKNILYFDNNLKNLINSTGKIVDGDIKKFLLSDFSQLTLLKKKIDSQHIMINTISEEYFLQRYKNFRNSQAFKIIQTVDISVCPYCNQNYINVITNRDGKRKFLGDFDHFYNKSTYPQFAICLYNLIPSCKVCNHLKGARKEKINYPYNQFNSRIKFETNFDKSCDIGYLNGNSLNFEVIINRSGLTSEELLELEIFNIEARYSQLKENAKEIIVKSQAYDKIYREQLMKDFQFSEDELKGMIFGYQDNHLNRTLSKFNFDIMNEFNSGNHK